MNTLFLCRTSLAGQAARLLPLVAVALLLSADFAWACPGCKNALESQANGQGIIQGYFWSILFMMSMPFAILGGMGSYLYWLVRKAKGPVRTNKPLSPASPATPAAATAIATDEPAH